MGAIWLVLFISAILMEQRQPQVGRMFFRYSGWYFLGLAFINSFWLIIIGIMSLFQSKSSTATGIKYLKIFNLVIGAIWHVLFGVAIFLSWKEPQVVLMFFCYTILFVLPGLVIINVPCLIIIGIISLFQSKSPTQTNSPLIGYIQRARKRGITQAEIQRRLKFNGWSDQDIQQALTNTKP